MARRRPIAAPLPGAAQVRPRVSVALAARNGERFLVEQVVSILPQLAATDELIISVDPSADGTLELARALAEVATAGKVAAAGDAAGSVTGTTGTGAATNAASSFAGMDGLRGAGAGGTAGGAPTITVLQGPGLSIATNFERALKACTGEIIFLADQDDVWLPDKVSTVLATFAANEVLLICHDAAVVDEHLALLEPSYFACHHSRGGLVRTILRNSYVGSCLALRRELLSVALPFPPAIPMHDQWLGCVAERHLRSSRSSRSSRNSSCEGGSGSNGNRRSGALFLDCPLILYRRHDASATGHRQATPSQMLAWRLALLRALAKRQQC
jgi:hypothetical protein